MNSEIFRESSGKFPKKSKKTGSGIFKSEVNHELRKVGVVV